MQLVFHCFACVQVSRRRKANDGDTRIEARLHRMTLMFGAMFAAMFVGLMYIVSFTHGVAPRLVPCSRAMDGITRYLAASLADEVCRLWASPPLLYESSSVSVCVSRWCCCMQVYAMHGLSNGVGSLKNSLSAAIGNTLDRAASTTALQLAQTSLNAVAYDQGGIMPHCNGARACDHCSLISSAAHCIHTPYLRWADACYHWRNGSFEVHAPWLDFEPFCIIPLALNAATDFVLTLPIKPSDVFACPPPTDDGQLMPRRIVNLLNDTHCMDMSVAITALRELAQSATCDDDVFLPLRSFDKMHAAIAGRIQSVVHSAMVPALRRALWILDDMSTSGAARVNLLTPDVQLADGRVVPRSAASRRSVDGLMYNLYTNVAAVAVPSFNGSSGAIGVQYRKARDWASSDEVRLCAEHRFVLSAAVNAMVGTALFAELDSPSTLRTQAARCAQHLQLRNDEQAGLFSPLQLNHSNFHTEMPCELRNPVPEPTTIVTVSSGACNESTTWGCRCPDQSAFALEPSGCAMRGASAVA